MQQALVVEDIPETSEWLSIALQSAFPAIQVTICRNLYESKTFLTNHTPDLCLVDISLPDGSGISLIPQLRHVAPDAYVVVTTIMDDQEHILAALKAGAQGYLLKDLTQPIFIEKLRGILKGEPPLSPKIARTILDYFSQLHLSIQAVPSPLNPDLSIEHQLSEREQEVLILLSKGFSRREVGRLLSLSDNTIATHIRNMYRKLNISSRAEAALEACRLGLIQQSF